MRLSEKGIQTLDRQAKAIKHYEAALMCLYPVRGEALEHWNKARAILAGARADAEISESDAVHLGKPDES